MNNLVLSIISSTLAVALCIAAWLSNVYDLNYAIYFFVGAAWGSVNLFLIKCLVEILLSNQSKNYIKMGLLLVIKFPLLYGAAYLLLRSDELLVVAFVWGLSLLFAMTVLLGIGFSLQKRT